MTTMAWPMFVMIAVVILLIIVGLILGHKNATSHNSGLENIEERLVRIEGNLLEYAESVKEQENVEPPVRQESPSSQEPEEEPEPQILQKKAIPEDVPEENGALQPIASEQMLSEKDLIKEQDANTDKGSEMPTSIYNIGKSGKVYTEEELDLLIKE